MPPQSPLLLLLPALLSCSEPKTYDQACSAPLPHWTTPEKGWHNLLFNKLHIDRSDNLVWNGEPVSSDQLSKYLSVVPTLNPVPATVLTVDPQASCSTVDAIRAEMDQKLQCRETRLCGEGEGEWLTGPHLLSDEELRPEQRRAIAEIEEEADRALERAEPQ